MARHFILGFVVLATATLTGAPAPVSGGFGIEKAQARDTYSRKRINGRWVTGTFHYKHRSAGAATDQKTAEAKPAPAAVGTQVAAAGGAGVVTTGAASPAQEPSATGSLSDYSRWLQREPGAPVSSLGETPQAFFAPTREIKSVVIDYQSGIKTVFYADGGVWEQPVVAEPVMAGSIKTWPLGAPQ